MKTDGELLQWFNDRLVWNSPTVVNELLRNGLFVREFAPQVSSRLIRACHGIHVACLCMMRQILRGARM